MNEKMNLEDLKAVHASLVAERRAMSVRIEEVEQQILSRERESHEYPHAVIELAWRVVNSARDTCAAANAVLVHRQLIGELREALKASEE